MIITRPKTEEAINEMIKTYDKIFVVGCGTCSTKCNSGGEEQVLAMVERLGDKAIGYQVVEEPCDKRLDRRDLKDYKDKIAEADALLVMSCGIGVQAVGDMTKKIVLPASDTLFMGETERLGVFHSKCMACGDCILDETGGICPITRCAKGLLNGPCGGTVKGKCEVGGYEEDCAWILIYDRLKEQGRMDLFTKFRPPRDYSKKTLLYHYNNR